MPALATMAYEPARRPVIIRALPPCMWIAVSAKVAQIAATGSPERAIKAWVYSTVVAACQVRRIGAGVRNANT